MFTLTRYLRGFRRKTFLAPDGRRQPCSRSLAIYEGFIAQPSKTQGPSPTLCTFARYLRGFRVEVIGPSCRPHPPPRAHKLFTRVSSQNAPTTQGIRQPCSRFLAIYGGFIAQPSKTDWPLRRMRASLAIHEDFTSKSSNAHAVLAAPPHAHPLFTRVSQQNTPTTRGPSKRFAMKP